MSIQVYGKQFTDIHFVAAAIDLKHKRETLRHLFVNDEDIVGTDGHVLHKTKNQGIEPGIYQIVKRTKTELQIIKSDTDVDLYPNYKRLFKNDYQIKELSGDIYQRFATIIRAMETSAVNFDYYKQSSPFEFNYFCAEENGAVYLKSDTREALIMTMKCA